MINKTSSSSAFVWLAVVIALGSAGGAWYSHEQLQRRDQQWSQWQKDASAQREKLQSEQSQLLQRLNAAHDQLQATQQEQENLRAIIAGGAERFAEAQRMHAAEYFIFEAEKILMLAQDVPAAVKLLATADSELQGSTAASAQALRSELQRDLQQLRGLLHVDALAVARQISDVQTRVDGLRSIAPILKEKSNTTAYDAEQDSWWGQFKANVAHFSGDWFLVREHALDVEAPLNALEARQVKQAISLSLANAQAAALRHEQGLYYNAITQAQQIVARHYGGDPNGVSITEQLQTLAQKLVSVTATISLQSAQTLRDDNAAPEATP